MTPGPSRLTLAAGIVFIVVGAMHGSGLPYAKQLAANGGDDLRSIMPVLWLGTSAGMTVAGLMLFALAWQPGRIARRVVALAALLPLLEVILLVVYAGLSAPVVIFSLAAVLAAFAAVRQPSGAA